MHYGIEFSVKVAWDAALEFGQNKEFLKAAQSFPLNANRASASVFCREEHAVGGLMNYGNEVMGADYPQCDHLFACFW